MGKHEPAGRDVDQRPETLSAVHETQAGVLERTRHGRALSPGRPRLTGTCRPYPGYHCCSSRHRGGCRRKVPKAGDEFTRLTNTGKNYYDQGQADKAAAALESALKLRPEHPDAHLNLANACLRANQPQKALDHAQEAGSRPQLGSGPFYQRLRGCASENQSEALQACSSENNRPHR